MKQQQIKERCIVAMLAKEYHLSRLREWKIERKRRHWSENTMTCYDLYHQAKDML